MSMPEYNDELKSFIKNDLLMKENHELSLQVWLLQGRLKSAISALESYESM